MSRELVSPDWMIFRSLKLITKGYLIGNTSAYKVTAPSLWFVSCGTGKYEYPSGSDQQPILANCLVANSGNRRYCFGRACKPGCSLRSNPLLKNCWIKDATGHIYAVHSPFIDLLSMNLCKSFFEFSDAIFILKLQHIVSGFRYNSVKKYLPALNQSYTSFIKRSHTVLPNEFCVHFAHHFNDV